MANEAATPAELGPVKRSELVRILRVAPTTVDAWRRAGCPVADSSGRAVLFLLPDVVEWLGARREQNGYAAAIAEGTGHLPAPADPVSMEAYRKRRARAETELVELALEEARAQVVPIDVVIEVLSTAIETARTRLRAFPGRYAGRFARLKTAPKVKAALQAAINEVLHELADGRALTDRARKAGRGSRIVRGAARRKG